jgi:AmiR/NasT family two-component response regulator
VIIEQAEGVLAGSSGLTPEEAFAVLRSHARGQGVRLTALAREVVDGTVDFTSIIRPAS